MRFLSGLSLTIVSFLLLLSGLPLKEAQAQYVAPNQIPGCETTLDHTMLYSYATFGAFGVGKPLKCNYGVDLNDYTGVKYTGTVQFWIDRRNTVWKDSSTYWLKVTIKYLNSGSLVWQTSTPETLKVHYDPAKGVQENDRCSHRMEFDSGSPIDSMFVVIQDAWNGSNVHPPTLTFPAGMRLDQRISVSGFPKLLCDESESEALEDLTISVTDLNDDGQDDFAPVSWSAVGWALEYDVEWTFIDEYYKDYYLPLEDGFKFARGATRITTVKSNFDIPLIYEKGIIYVRVRPVSRRGMAGEQRWEGRWTAAESLVVGKDHGRWTQAFPDPDPDKIQNLNWTSSTVFAEEGKCNVSVNYFDGLSRSRQSVSSVNSNTEEQVAIVTETFYNFSGKAAVTTLPSPVLGVIEGTTTTIGSVLKYYENFNQRDGEPYRDIHFDDLAGPGICTTGRCSTQVLACPMDSASGASRYYSSSNPLMIQNTAFPSFPLDPHNNMSVSQDYSTGYLPRAFGYPFVHTEFTPDETGRVLRQGGAGLHHQIGTGHETQFFYGTPTQRELNRLFGTDVGWAEHYFKKVIRDPNGSLSLSYEDMKGRVIATALLGVSEAELDPNLERLDNDLGEEDQDPPVMEDLMKSGDNKLLDDYILFFSKSILIEKEGAYKFDYTLESRKMAEVMGSVCPTCAYELEITLQNQCGDHLLASYEEGESTVTLSEGIYTQTITQEDNVNCEGTPDTWYTTFGSVEMTSQNLVVGEYVLTKKLKLDKKHIEDKVSEYKTAYQTLNPVEEVIESRMGEEDFPESGCFGCLKCTAYLGESPVCTTLVAAVEASDPVRYKALLTSEALAKIQWADAGLYCNVPIIGDYLQQLKDIHGSDYVLTDRDRRKAILLYREVLNSCSRQSCTECNGCADRCGSCGDWSEEWISSEAPVCSLVTTFTGLNIPFLAQKCAEYQAIYGDTYVLSAEERRMLRVDYENLKKECLRLSCKGTEPPAYNPCESAYQTMLSDMIPQNLSINQAEGITMEERKSQYAGYRINSDGSYDLSEMDGTIWALRQNVVFHDEDGSVSRVWYKKEGDENAYLEEANKVSAKVFIENWRSSWAKDLVVYHPEYCSYLACKHLETAGPDDKGTFYYDDALFKVETYAEACSLRLFLPVAPGSLVLPSCLTSCFPDPPTTGQYDPLCDDCGILESEVSGTVGDQMVSYKVMVVESTTVTLSIWDVAAYMTTNGHYDLTTSDLFCTVVGNASTETKNRIWQNYRGLYHSLKQKAVYRCLTSIDPGCVSCTTRSQLLHGGNVPSGKTRRFIDPEEFVSGLGISTSDPTRQESLKSRSSEQLGVVKQAVCGQYAEQWRKVLSSCYGAGDPRFEELIRALQSVCENNLDENNPLGAGEPAPGETATTANSVQAVFHDFVTNKGLTLTATCNPYRLSLPVRGQNIDVESGLGLIDNCACQKLSGAYDAYLTAAPSHHSFSRYLTDYPLLAEDETTAVAMDYTDRELMLMLHQCRCMGSGPEGVIEGETHIIPSKVGDWSARPLVEVGVSDYDLVVIDAIPTTDGGIISLGRMDEQVLAGEQGFFVQKIGYNGESAWSRRMFYSGADGGSPLSIRETEAGYAVISYLHNTGNWLHTHLSRDGGLLSSGETEGAGNSCGLLTSTVPTCPLNLTVKTSVAGIGAPRNELLIGSNARTHNGGISPMIMQVDSGGKPLWSKGYILDTVNRKAYFTQVNPVSGGSVAVGTIQETVSTPRKELLLSRLDSKGNVLWHRTFQSEDGDTNLTGLYSGQTRKGGFLTVGALSHESGHDVYAFLILETDADGRLLSSRRLMLADTLGAYRYSARTLSVTVTESGHLLVSAARINLADAGVKNSIVLEITEDLEVAGAVQVDAPLSSVELWSARESRAGMLICGSKDDGLGRKALLMGLPSPVDLRKEFLLRDTSALYYGSYRVSPLQEATLSVDTTVLGGSLFLMKAVPGYTVSTNDTNLIVHPGFYVKDTAAVYDTDSYGKIYNKNKRLIHYYSDRMEEVMTRLGRGFPGDACTLDNPGCDPEYAIIRVEVSNDGAEFGTGRSIPAVLFVEAVGRIKGHMSCGVTELSYNNFFNLQKSDNFSAYWKAMTAETDHQFAHDYAGGACYQELTSSSGILTMKVNRRLWLDETGVDVCSTGVVMCFISVEPEEDAVGMNFSYDPVECCDPCSTQIPLMQVPMAIKCGTCKTCTQIADAIGEFNAYLTDPPLSGVSGAAPFDDRYSELWTNFLNRKFGFNLSHSDYVEFINKNCGIDTNSSNPDRLLANAFIYNSTHAGAKLCNKSVFPRLKLNKVPDCFLDFYDREEDEIRKGYALNMADSLQTFRETLTRYCRTGIREALRQQVQTFQYQFTLYYYDQSGSLIMTVPPRAAVAGHLLSGEGIIGDAGTVNAKRISDDETVLPSYADSESGSSSPYHLTTRYNYNSLKAVIASESPDGGKSEFWYDEVGQLVLSQNARQEQEAYKRYSYTLRDGLNRPYEGGEVKQVGSPIPDPPYLISASADHFLTTAGNAFYDWVRLGINMDVTRSYYDDIKFSGLERLRYGLSAEEAIDQRNLRNRVASVAYHPGIYEAGAADEDERYASAMHYTYDVAGNADMIVTDVPELEKFYNRFFRIAYDFDLVSGNVHRVMYQWDRPDRFFHMNRYDADNRLTEVSTAPDEVHFSNDAEYHYSLHDPMYRMVLGEYQVQGLDFAYTIQGWIKGVNSNTLVPERDMGRDGWLFTPGIGATPNINANVARDVFGYTLGYFTHYHDGEGAGMRYDYEPVGMGKYIRNKVELVAGNHFEANYMDGSDPSNLISAVRPLYNGNISSSVTALPQEFPDSDCEEGYNPLCQPLGSVYRYDHLNRLKESKTFFNLDLDGNHWLYDTGISSEVEDAYRTNYTYDPNGNILGLKRYDLNGSKFDDLTYNYAGSGTNNRLLRIDDAVGDSHASIPDLLDQGSGDNYTYDAIGNLKSDVSEGTLNIGWNVGGKVTRVLKAAQWLGFDYDVMGNRLLKRLADKRSLYVRDAHGNTMAVYETQTRKEEEDTDRTTDSEVEKQMFVRLLHEQMDGTTAEKTDHFLKKFIYPLEGVSSVEVSTLRGTLIYAMDYGSSADAAYNDAVDGIEELTGGSTDINKDNFGTLVELWFRNHAWSGSIPEELYRTRHRKLVQKEVHLYGSSRLGLMERRTNETDFLMLADIQVEEVWNPFNNSYIAENRINTVSSPQPETTRFVGTLGLKRYELCNHLGNVQAVITDRTLPHNNSGTIDFYIADLLSATDYYPFGMVLPGRSLETDKYRFGFNGKEFDKEWNAGEMTYDYGFRIYDPRIIRFLSVDPITKKYPELTPYQFASNTPIVFVDIDGLEGGKHSQLMRKCPKFLNPNHNGIARRLRDLFTRETKVKAPVDFNQQQDVEPGVYRLRVEFKDTDDAFRDPEKAEKLIGDFAEKLKKNPKLVVDIEGVINHDPTAEPEGVTANPDYPDTPEGNQKLANDRAKAVENVLLEKGVDKKQIGKVKGAKPGTKLLERPSDPDNPKVGNKNKRVDLEVRKKKK